MGPHDVNVATTTSKKNILMVIVFDPKILLTEVELKKFNIV